MPLFEQNSAGGTNSADFSLGRMHVLRQINSSGGQFCVQEINLQRMSGLLGRKGK